MISYDIVLSDGSLINVRADNEYADLYRCLPWSHGTLGFLVAIELSIIRVKPYIHLKYLSVHVHLICIYILSNNRSKAKRTIVTN